MLDHRHFRSALIAAIASMQITALAMAEMPSKKEMSAFPEMLNEPVIPSGQDGPVVFQISQSWGKLLRGSRLIGEYHWDNERVGVCIQRIFFADRQQENAKPGQCLAQAAPTSETIILRKTNGTLIVPQGQPFYLYDMPVEWERAGPEKP